MTDTEMQRRKAICDIAGVADIGELSDGFHTFNGLYKQRMILFAALVKAYKDKAWKSYRHEDGELCFGGGWFIVGIDTPDGSYTYHYEDKYFSLFDCEELKCGKHWDGHTEKDVTRLLSLPSAQQETSILTVKCELDDEELSRAIEAVKNAELESIAAQQEQRWIPCSERLPENTEPVNITWVNRKPEPYYADIKDKPFTATGHYCNGKWWWYSAVCQDYLDEYGECEMDEMDGDIEVIAWMPLPEPYKEEES